MHIMHIMRCVLGTYLRKLFIVKSTEHWYQRIHIDGHF